METPQTNGNGIALTVISFLMFVFNFLTAEQWLRIISLVISCAAGLMAIRHYYLAGKKR
jgi:hypothetical protein